MSTKLRLKFEVTVEFNANPRNYPKSKRTPEGMLEVDLISANDDPFAFLSQDAEWKITGEVVGEDA